MSIRKLLGATALMLALAMPALAAPLNAACVLHQHRVTSVAPYNVPEAIGRGATVQRLRGAELFVRAEPGLTVEWLRLELSRHVVAMSQSGMENCPLNARDVRIQVDSAGAGFSVKLIARDADKAQQILNSARHLLAS